MSDAPPPKSRAQAFGACVMLCADDAEFVAAFDRLTKSNLQGRGSPLDLAIDDATGRPSEDAKLFVAFVYDVVWSRLDAACRDAIERGES